MAKDVEALNQDGWVVEACQESLDNLLADMCGLVCGKKTMGKVKRKKIEKKKKVEWKETYEDELNETCEDAVWHVNEDGGENVGEKIGDADKAGGERKYGGSSYFSYLCLF